eukprot:17480-Prorocentrum_minimum.AAC.1
MLVLAAASAVAGTCPSGCAALSNDGDCDEVDGCNIAACGYDGGDCPVPGSCADQTACKGCLLLEDDCGWCVPSSRARHRHSASVVKNRWELNHSSRESRARRWLINNRCPCRALLSSMLAGRTPSMLASERVAGYPSGSVTGGTPGFCERVAGYPNQGFVVSGCALLGFVVSGWHGNPPGFVVSGCTPGFVVSGWH